MKKIIFGLITIAVVGLIWYSNKGSQPPASSTPPPSPTPSTQQQNNPPTPQPTPTPTPTPPPTGLQMPTSTPDSSSSPVLEGTLQASNNSGYGNYMLLLENGKTIYISTSRNYSSLVGKKVVINYSGTLEDFTLKDIVEKQ